MPVRTWQYYVAHPQEIEAMQKICREWSAGNAPAASEPAVVATNCRAAAFAKSQRQITPRETPDNREPDMNFPDHVFTTMFEALSNALAAIAGKYAAVNSEERRSGK